MYIFMKVHSFLSVPALVNILIKKSSLCYYKSKTEQGPEHTSEDITSSGVYVPNVFTCMPGQLSLAARVFVVLVLSILNAN